MPIGSDRRTRCAVVTGVIILGVLAPGAAPRAAAGTGQVRYVGPDGSGSDCTKVAPCELRSAVATAPSGAVVILEAGSYGTAQDPIGQTIANGIDGDTYRSITIEGEPGQPVPTIHAGADYGVMLINSFIKRVTIAHSGSVGGLELVNAVASQIQVESPGNSSACEVFNSSIIDAVCDDTGDRGNAVLADALAEATNTSTIRNVTAIAGTNTTTIKCLASGGSTCSMELDNTIVGIRGSAGCSANDKSQATISGTNNRVNGTGSVFDSTSTAQVNVSHSVTSPPVFADAANGDFHETSSSPTVDAGTSDNIGSLDLDGLPRLMGNAPDIGAYEVPVAADVRKAHVTHHGKRGLGVTAVVDTQGLPAVATLVAKSGDTTITSHRKVLDADTRQHKLKLAVKHLSPHTQYSLQVVVTDAGGTTKEPVSTTHR